MNDSPTTSEERVDATLEDSFPASDAPSWTLGVQRLAARGAPVESDARLEDIVFPPAARLTS
jgi:hypothetical protein